MKVLAFCFFPAFVPPSNGGQSRVFNFYRTLSRWHQITLLTSTHINIQEELIQHGLNFVERRIPKDDYFVRKWQELEKYSSGGDLSAPTIVACGRSPTLLHKAYLEEYERAEIIFHDSPFTVDYDLFARTDNKLRIYNSYNCENLLYRQLHPSVKSKNIHDLICSAEQRTLEIADLVLYCSESDLEAFRLLAPSSGFESLYAPNGMTPIASPIKGTQARGTETFNAVFMGSGHTPNVQAAEFIVGTLAPVFPQISFHMVGSCLPEGSYPANLIRHGVVDDGTKAHILSLADIALNPMTEGSGSNVKVLEYFAYGIPVLSTAFGMRGIHARARTHYLEGSIDSFNRILKKVVSGKESISAIGRAGRSFALEQYTWDAITRRVSDQIDTIVKRKKYVGQQRCALVLNDYDSFSGIGGGSTRTRGLCEAIQGWIPVVFVSFSDDGSLVARRHEQGITTINVPKTPEHISDADRFNALFHISVDDITAARHCRTNPWLNAVYKVLRRSARCIIVEHCYLAGLPLSFADRFIYSSQNNETELKRRLLEWHPLKSELVADVERIERLAVEHSAATITVSLEDAESLVKGKRTAGPVIVIRNGAAKPTRGAQVKHAQQSLIKEIGNRAVVFLGSAHMPNVEAAYFIVNQLAPKFPDVRFHLVGSVCGAIQQTPHNVHLWGVVDELTKSAILQSCALALNPMSSGSGSNVKLADYLGNGLFTITTDFGQRGYPTSVSEHLAIVSMDSFSEAIEKLLTEQTLLGAEVRARRTALFDRELTMRSIANLFVQTLQSLEKTKKRVLYIAYRYTTPNLGGAELNIEKFVSALGHSGEFDVDVVAPEISGIHNHFRFNERYSFNNDVGVPVDIPNTRFARFPVDTLSEEKTDAHLRNAWAEQPNFERALDQELQKDYRESGLTWGWTYPEVRPDSVARWAFTECALFLDKSAELYIEGFSNSVVATAYSDGAIVGGPWSIEGPFSLSLQVEAGELRLVSSAPQIRSDPRPLALLMSKIKINGALLDLLQPTLLQKYLPLLPAEQAFELLDKSAEATRSRRGVRLTEGRGPWSRSLEQFVSDRVKDYDLVVTHNNVFRPAVIAIEEARKHGVPSILIPHAHLDDDFYHFPDLLESARNASLVLAVPKAACKFLAQKGCNVRYLPAGCDTSEQFTNLDREAFRQLHPSNRPFILVLGRKAGAKGYKEIIDAVEKLNGNGIDLQVVLIGPDDDGFPITSPNAVYLGRQSRNIVRGALLSCLALCNMSSSESFGIVLLEAWMAGRPVIANKNCAAFHDLVSHGVDGLLVSEDNLADAIVKLLINPELRNDLASAGRTVPQRFSWETVENEFVQLCLNLVENYCGVEHRKSVPVA